MSGKGTRFSAGGAAAVCVVAGLTALAVLVQFEGPPGAIPVHFDFNGVPDRWGDRSEVRNSILGTAAVATGLAILFKVFSRKPGAVERAGINYRVFQSLALALPAFIGGLMGCLAFSAGEPSLSIRYTNVWLGLLMVGCGGLLGKTQPNALVGVRTYWALTSRLAWDKSNRLVGRLWFWLGLLVVAAAPLAPEPLGMQATVALLVGSALLGAAESYRVWRNDPDRRSNAGG